MRRKKKKETERKTRKRLSCDIIIIYKGKAETKNGKTKGIFDVISFLSKGRISIDIEIIGVWSLPNRGKGRKANSAN